MAGTFFLLASLLTVFIVVFGIITGVQAYEHLQAMGVM
jgi:hypothetical protein